MIIENIDPDLKLEKDEYERLMPDLVRRLGVLQREAVRLKIPVVILFEGVDASGKGEQINRLIRGLDPRGFDVFAVGEPTVEEVRKPFFWRFWMRSPARGRISVFSRGWYHRTIAELGAKAKNDGLLPAVGEIRAFERALAADGYLFVKFFLHIAKNEQKKRLTKLDDDPVTTWLVTEEEWQGHNDYEEYLRAMGALIERTDVVSAPWTIVPANDRRYAEVMIYTKVIEALDVAVMAAGKPSVSGEKTDPGRVATAPGRSLLASIDLGKTLADDVYHRELDRCQKELRKAQYRAYAQKVPVVVIFEGWDAAGKGGAIKRLTGPLDPRGYRVVPVGPPDPAEQTHHYLWRFWQRFPEAGHIVIFDRSWYGRVLVERVDEFCARAEWQRAYAEINELEAALVDAGAVLVKCWLHISLEEQLRRFQAREADPFKTWKITPEDWRNREQRDLYLEAADEMLTKTGTAFAPWTIVEAEDKNYARNKVMKTVTGAINNRLK